MLVECPDEIGTLDTKANCEVRTKCTEERNMKVLHAEE